MILLAGSVLAGAGPVILAVFVAPLIIIHLVSRLWIYGKKKGDSKLPPGDMGWPIVGSTFSLFRPHPVTTLGDFLELQLSSLAIRITMGMTADDPEVEELRKAFMAIGDGLYAVPLNLPFTRYSKALKVINETLRLGNVATGLWQKTLSDVNYNKGCTIPQGTTVMTHFAAMHLDPSLFENPNLFYPSRWLAIKKSNNWMPFGGSVRQCSGSEIARMEISVFLRHLMLNYDWEPAEPDHPVAVPLVTFPKGYPIRIRPLKERTP